METITIHYLFTLPNGKQEVMEILLDAETLDLMNKIPESLPEWTMLDYHQCSNCLLALDTHKNCPIAVHFVKLLEIFESLLSFDTIHVDIFTAQRVTTMDTSAQKGASSLMGLIMATSGCPHMAFFKPMARFHLPLSSAEETVYRAASMYLLAQYFRKKEGLKIDLELNGLKELYRNIHIINKSMSGRLRDRYKKDVGPNSLTILDSFAQTLTMVIEEQLDELRYLFRPYLLEP
ncbi:MAG: hypothetical protein AB1552_04535 [Nitrospirota bacterium]